MTEREALKLALEALQSKYIVNCGAWRVQQDKAITAIKEALAQPEQEPCRHRIADIRNEAIKSGYMCMDCGALFGAYTTPPQRKPLTDVTIWNTYKNLWMFHPAEEPRLAGDVLNFARAIEAAHGIKG